MYGRRSSIVLWTGRLLFPPWLCWEAPITGDGTVESKEQYWLFGMHLASTPRMLFYFSEPVLVPSGTYLCTWLISYVCWLLLCVVNY